MPNAIAPSPPPFDGRLTVVVPVRNEAGNLAPLIAEIAASLRQLPAFETVCVDDGSDDGTADELRALAREHRELRVVRHARTCGQSAAIQTGVRCARHAWVATLDGDGQNDPADIPRLLNRLCAAQDATRPAMLVGWRKKRNDSWLRRASSRVANGVRSRILRDRTPDTGCGLKVFWRDAFLRLPSFDHMHRFLPALIQRAGWRVESVPVGHRPRIRGTSKYGLFDRLWVGIVDLFGVGWLMARARIPEVIDG